MNVAIGIFLLGAMVIALGGAILTNVKIWGLLREARASLRALPPDRRRSVLIRLAVMYIFVLAEAIIVLAAPFGVRRTLTYVVILPFVVVGPTAVIIVGVTAFRRQRRRASSAGPPDH